MLPLSILFTLKDFSSAATKTIERKVHLQFSCFRRRDSIKKCPQGEGDITNTERNNEYVNDAVFFSIHFILNNFSSAATKTIKEKYTSSLLVFVGEAQ